MQRGSSDHRESDAKLAATLSSQASSYGIDQGRPLDCTDNEEKAGEEDETTPLSGNPYFTSIMSKSQVRHPFHLLIPARFHSHLPQERGMVVLLYRGKSWTISYRGDRSPRLLDTGWRSFAVDNGLQVGDACILQLMDGNERTFRVQILRGDLPPEVTPAGSTAGKPIVIAD